MKIMKTLLGAMAALFIGEAAAAATVKVTFSGTIDFVRGFDSTPIALGQKVSMTHYIDTSASPLATAQTSSVFPLVGTDLTFSNLSPMVSFDAATAGSPYFNTIQAIASSAFGTQYQIGSNGNFGVTVGSFINFPIGQVFNINNLAPFVDQLQTNGAAGLSQTNRSNMVFGFTGLGWWGDCSTAQYGCSALALIDTVDVSQIQAVPVPAALPLMMLGLTGLGLMGRRKRAKA